MADSFSVKPVPDLLSGVVYNCAGIRMRRWGWRPGFCFQCHYSSQLWSDRQASREKKAKQGAGIVLDDSVCMLHWCSFSLCWLSRPLLGLLGSVFQYKKSIVPMVLSKIYDFSHRLRGPLPRTLWVSDGHVAFLHRLLGESAQPLGSELGGQRSEIVLAWRSGWIVLVYLLE